MTFSITAVEQETNKVGVAIASVFPAVGAVCPWVGESGAISSQAWDSGADYGEPAMAMLDYDLTLPTAAEALISDREGGSGTQLHGVEMNGRTFAYTGERCVRWAGHIEGETHTAAGNMLTGSEVVEAASNTFQTSDASFEERLLNALEAGEEAGGDKRGDNLSAALLVHAPEPKLYHNLRVDMPGTPISDLWKAYETARETENSSNVGELAEYWDGSIPESVTEYRIRY